MAGQARVLICGFYGFGNTGDEAILAGMVASLRRLDPGVEITVLSGSPEETSRRYGVKALYIGRRLSGLYQVAERAKRADLFILGGGGLLQDRQTRIVPFWLSRAFIALLAGTPVMFYAQGIGPLRTSLGRNLVRLAADRSRLITVRDEASRDLLLSLGVRTPIYVTADPAAAIEMPPAETGQEILDRFDVPRDMPLMGLNLRFWPGADRLSDLMKEVIPFIARKLGVHVVFVSMRAQDEEMGKRLKAGLESEMTVLPPLDPYQTASVLGRLEVMLGMRLHAIILSALSGVPFVGLAYDPKVTAFARRLEMTGQCLDIEASYLDGDKVKEIITRIFASRQILQEKIRKHMKRERELAEENARLALSLIAKDRGNEELG